MTLGLQTNLAYFHFLLSKGSYTPEYESSPGQTKVLNFAMKELTSLALKEYYDTEKCFL